MGAYDRSIRGIVYHRGSVPFTPVCKSRVSRSSDITCTYVCERGSLAISHNLLVGIKVVSREWPRLARPPRSLAFCTRQPEWNVFWVNSFVCLPPTKRGHGTRGRGRKMGEIFLGGKFRFTWQAGRTIARISDSSSTAAESCSIPDACRKSTRTPRKLEELVDYRYRLVN